MTSLWFGVVLRVQTCNSICQQRLSLKIIFVLIPGAPGGTDGDIWARISPEALLLFSAFRCYRFRYKSVQRWDNSVGLNSPGCCSGAGSLPPHPVFSHAVSGRSCPSYLPFTPAPSRNCPSQSSTVSGSTKQACWKIYQDEGFSKIGDLRISPSADLILNPFLLSGAKAPAGQLLLLLVTRLQMI